MFNPFRKKELDKLDKIIKEAREQTRKDMGCQGGLIFPECNCACKNSMPPLISKVQTLRLSKDDLLVVTVGNKDNPPTSESIKRVREQFELYIKEFTHGIGILFVPYMINLKVLRKAKGAKNERPK